MLFRQLVLSAAIVLAISGCSDQPSGSDSTTPDTGNGSGNSTTSDSSTTPGTPTPPSTQPGSGGNVTPPTLPTNRSTLTISGPVAGSQETDTYAFKVCSGQVCEQWQSTVAEGGFEYTFQLSQWPLDQIVTVEGSKLVSASANSARAFSNASVDAQSASYFHTELDTLTNILKMDSNDDGYIDQTELPTISLDPVTIAFNTVAKHLLQSDLSHFKNLPYAKKQEAVRRKLSDNSKATLVKLNSEQIQKLKSHVSKKLLKKFYGTYTLTLTDKQWAAIEGPLSTPSDQRNIELNTAQIRTLYTRDKNRKATNKEFTLSVAQAYSVHKKLIYNQRLVIELAALYQLMRQEDPIAITLGNRTIYEVNQQIDQLNPGQKNATRFEGDFHVTLDKDIQQQIGMYDRPDGEPSTLLFSAETMRDVYQKSQQARAENKSSNYLFHIEPMTWPTNGKTNLDVGARMLEMLSANPSKSLLELYEDQFGAITGYKELSIPTKLQKIYRFESQINELVTANHKHPLKSSLLALAPERKLRIKGRLPKALTEASLTIILGSRPNPEPGSYFDNGRNPIRHQPVTLLNQEGERKTMLDLSGKADFETTIVLRDIDNLYSYCRPGRPEDSTSGAYELEYSSDEMQDTLAVHIHDNKTGVELRSVLGSFCEISQIAENEGNKNSILEYQEFERLNVGYISTAQAAMLLKSSASGNGSLIFMAPWRHEDIVTKYRQMPREQVELLASFLALQAQGKLFASSVDLVERGSLYNDLLALLDMDLSQLRVTTSNRYPSIENIRNKISSSYAIGQVLIDNPDINISHIIQQMTSLLGDSEPDQYYFPTGLRPGRWVSVQPVSHLDATCKTSLQDNQLIGLRIEGKGKNQTGHWVTIGWDSQPGSSSYTLAWDETRFDNITSAQNVIPTEKLRATISELDATKQYYISVQSNVGDPSVVLTYSPRHIHVADTRTTQGLANDDSARGRDTDSSCDPLTGKAANSNKDGLLGARYIKLDSKGLPLSRQDLSYQQHPFTCVLDAHTGLVWETKYKRKETDPYGLYDNDNLFVIKAQEGADTFNGTCTVPKTKGVSTDPAMCTVANQIDWVNQDKRCGLTNWRVPTLHEAYSLLDFGQHSNTNLDNNYFPNSKFKGNGIWLDAPSVDGKNASVLDTPRLQTISSTINSANALMLVSDGFYASQQP